MSNSNGSPPFDPASGNISMFTPRRIPTFQYTVQNIIISLATIASAVSSLLLTCFVALPLSIIRVFLPETMLSLSETAGKPSQDNYPRNPVVLIVGASRGIGMNVLKQYSNEPETTIIAVASSMDSITSTISQLGVTKARIQPEALNLLSPSDSIAQAIEEYERKYGPITHLYAISGISNHIDDSNPWGLDVTMEMTSVNVNGIVSVVLATYDKMKLRRYGKICVVGSVVGLFNPANIISYAATKSFINTFASSLRVLAARYNIDVVTVQPGTIETRMTSHMRDQGSTLPDMEFASAEGMASAMKHGVEKGGVGVVSWPIRQSVVMYALRGMNPICEELGKWASMDAGIAGKKIT